MLKAQPTKVTAGGTFWRATAHWEPLWEPWPCMWRVIKTLTDCKRSTTQISEDRDLPDTLNQAQGGADTPLAPPAKTTAQSPWPKCFQRMMLSHVKNRLPADVGSHHFAYRANRSAEDAASITLHTALSHMEHPNTYVRMRFIEALPSIPSPPPWSDA